MRSPAAQNELASFSRIVLEWRAPRNQKSTEPNEGCDQPAPAQLPSRRSTSARATASIGQSGHPSAVTTRQADQRGRAREWGGRSGRRCPYLGHDCKQCARHTLFVGKSALGDEERATREHEIRPEYDDYRARKPVRPIGLAVSDEREEYIPKRCEKGADTCGRSGPPAERRIVMSAPRLPIRYTTGTLPTNKAIKTLHMMPVTKLGNSRTIVRIGERRR